MSVSRIAAASLFAALLGAFALHVGCASDDEPECTKDSNCVSAKTACTKGVCKEGKCSAEALPDTTRVDDQSAVAGKFCVKMGCVAGKLTEVANPTKTPDPVECQTQSCEGTSPKSTPIMDGVPCRLGGGTCQGGVCVLNPDTGPIGPKDTGMDETGDADMGDTEMDAATD